ncbi:MAG: putative monovalent cation/H+ antiporter subunit A [Ardenticatenaceae bacterium]|nr:putative monovalent cation/H+ antiporter subunit A [Ardenticatenaceae bacterium]MCB8946795.1 putative monovalent cation/H+ antiporter subunit A [Ardenticatenaceae bacterium]
MHDAIAHPGLVPALLSGYTLSLIVPMLTRVLRQMTGWFLALLPLALFVQFLTMVDEVAKGQILTANIPWVPSLNVNLSFVVDGWGLFLALVVTGMGALVIIYASSYLQGNPAIGRFYTFILIFMASMLVLVLADNIFLMFIAWELTSIASFFLIGFYHEKEKSQKAALQALLVTGTGGLAMLAGFVGLTAVSGTSSFQELHAQAGTLLQSPYYLPILALILLGAFTKSAQFPFHFWLPNAMAGPAPVSTYLHSATMVKAGVYLLGRLQPTLGQSSEWFYIVTIVGAVTALLGAWLSWQKTDMKEILAYSTISALGTLVLLIGIGTELALQTAVLFLLVHALYKGGLFMAAGIIDHETGTRDVRELGGLWRQMPWTFTAVLLAAFSMSGLPPFLGFIGKELMYETTLELSFYSQLLTGVLLLTNILMVTAALILLIQPFFGSPKEAHPHHKTPFNMWLGPVVLGGLALLLGLLASSEAISEALVAPAVSAIAGSELHVHLALWHGLTPMLALSGVTLLGGVGLFVVHTRLQPGVVRLDTAVRRVGPEKWYGWLLDGMLGLAGWFTEKFQNGKLRYYLMYVLVSALVLVGGTLAFRTDIVWEGLELTPLRLPEVILALVLLAAVGVVVRVESRLTAVAALGVVGYSIAVFYILFSAPDLAMTQFAIETLTVILFVLVLYRLPRFDRFSSRHTRVRDGVVAAAVGLLMAGLTLMAQSVHVRGASALADYFIRNTEALAGGHNVVNVILVDFRGFDTMVEITVLSVAAIGVYALLKSRTFNLERAQAEQTAVTEPDPAAEPIAPQKEAV